MGSRLGARITRNLAETPSLPPESQDRLGLDSIAVVGNHRRMTIQERIEAMPQRLEAAVAINGDMPLDALAIGRPAGYEPGAMPADPPPPSAGEGRAVAGGAARHQQAANVFAETARLTGPRP